ncbi:MAG: hypothetical protein QXJ51_05210 [Sulfolobales archaeon]
MRGEIITIYGLEIIFLQILASSSIYLFLILGEILSERSGVVNLSLEGSIALGASVAYALTIATGESYVGLICGALAGLIPSLSLALTSVYLTMNMIAAGLAISSIFSAFSIVIGNIVPRSSQNRIIIFSEYHTIIFFLLLSILISIMLRILLERRIGFMIRSAGEDPYSAYSMGVNVWRIRTLSIAFSGIMGGLAGSLVVLMPVISIIWREGITSGMGFVAVAITPLTLWSSLLAIPVALFLGGVYQLSIYLQISGIMKISTEISSLIPYTIALAFYIISRIIISGKRGRLSSIPRAIGRELVLEERYE